MSISIQKIEKEALRLSSTERARLAKHLILSLENEDDPDAEGLWVEEAERRYHAYKKGEIKVKPAKTVFKEARARLK